MKSPRNTFLAITCFVFGFSILGFSQAANVYITPNGQAQGACTTNPQSPAWFNNPANWGTGTSQIGPGTTVNLCGTIATELTAHGSGTSSAPITISFESNAMISLPYCDNNNGCLNISGLSWIVVDGGTNGIIQNTANGSQLANQVDSVGIMANGPSCLNCEIKNLNIINLYVHSLPGDTHNFGVTGGIFAGGVSGNAFLKIHDNVCHDVRACLSYNPVANDSGLQVYNNNFYNADGINIENNGVSLVGYAIHDNQIHDIANWDASGCPYHHDGIHSWALTGGTSSGELFYNNLISGNFGTCPTGALFFEGTHSNSQIYNNVFMITYTQENNGIVNVNGTNFQVYDNTIIGDSGVGSDICFNIGAASGRPSITFENNILVNCNTLLLTQNSPKYTLWDYNTYGGCAATGCNSGTPIVVNGSSFDTFAAWQAACACDSHSQYGAPTSFAGLNSSGVPQSGSPAINDGANMTSIGLAALDSDTSAGDTRTPTARPAGACGAPGQSSCWTIGAYNYGSGGPNPPTNLSAVVGN